MITVTDYQPDDTIAIDTMIVENAPNGNYATDVNLIVGCYWTSDASRSILIGLDWLWNGNGGSNCPKNKKFKLLSDVKLSLYVLSVGSGGSAYWPHFCYVKRPWTENGATWNTYDGVNAWGTAGANNDTTDVLNTGFQRYGGSASSWWDIYIPAGVVEQSKLGVYFGIIIRDFFSLANYAAICASSSYAADVSKRPKYSFDYEVPFLISIPHLLTSGYPKR